MDIMKAGADWLEAASELPKLFLSVEPGTMTPEDREYVRGFKNLTEVTVPGGHMVTEDSPKEVGLAIYTWLRDAVA